MKRISASAADSRARLSELGLLWQGETERRSREGEPVKVCLQLARRDATAQVPGHDVQKALSRVSVGETGAVRAQRA